MKLWRIVAALALLGAVGCSALSPEAKKELQDGSRIGQKRVVSWDKLTDAQKKQAYREATQVLVDLDYSICGTPLPSGYEKGTVSK